MRILRWIDNVGMTKKMSFLALLAIVSLVFPTYFYSSLSNEITDITQREVEGLKPTMNMVTVTVTLAKFRAAATAYVNGNKTSGDALESESQKIEKDLNALLEEIGKLGYEGQINYDIKKIIDDKNRIKSLVLSGQIDYQKTFFQVSQLVEDSQFIIRKMLEESGLTYDSSPASYHLIIASMENLPRMAHVLGMMRGVGVTVLNNGSVSPGDAEALTAYMATLSYPFRDYIHNLENAAVVNPDFKFAGSKASGFKADIESLLNLVDREIVSKTTTTYEAQTYFSDFTKVIDNLVQFNEETLASLEDDLLDRLDGLNNQRFKSLIIIFVLMSIFLIIGLYIIRGFITSLASMRVFSGKIASADFSTTLGLDRKDEIGELAASLENMKAQLEANAKASQENYRIRQALDGASSNVMLADTGRNIVYMNKAVEKMLRAAEADLRAVLPHFAVDKVLGSNMDSFHKNPAHQMKLLENLTTTYTSNIIVGKRHFRLIANPIFSKEGARLGSVVEWLDRTDEVAVEMEVSKVVEAAASGDFSERLITQGKEGFFLKLAEGLNTLVNTADKGLNDVARVLGAIAKGDLTERINAEYSGTFGDLKNYCNETTESLTTMLSEIRGAADMIFTASSEIAQGNADLSSRTEQQAANLEETASSMEELTSTVKLNADNAKQANVLAEQASTVAVDGGALIQQVVTTMNAINESARKISDIIGVIDGIAFQTNILALNAAVEAARAGDQGRGFAVVASEVRTLAQRSANAAKDIKALISDSVQKIDNGNSLVGKSGDTMKEIVSAIKRVNDIMAEIAAASAEQSTGIEEVSTAVSQMDEMTQQNAALVEEAAAAAESLQSQADQLNRNVAQFRLDEGYEAVQPATRASAPKSRALAAPAKATAKPAAPKKLAPPKSSAEDEWEQF